MPSTGAGALNERLRFEKRPAVGDDGYGNTEGEWTAQFTCAARIRPLRGSETVIGQRLAGVQPVLISIRSSRAARAVDPSWRAIDTRSGTVYNLRAGANFDEVDAVIDIIAETGVPV